MIAPFRGIHYNFKKIRDLSRVVVPPYDIISARGHDYFLQMHPYNFVRVVKGEKRLGDDEEHNIYTRAAEHFHTWLREEVFLRDVTPCLYYYRQEFTLGDRKRWQRDGLVASVKLTEDAIFPHEAIMPEPTEDRFQLLSACRANLSPIFTAYPDPTLAVRTLCEKILHRPPFIDVMDNLKVRHLLWRINVEKSIEEVCRYLRPTPLYIVDGHHRYSAAIKYRNRMRKERGYLPDAPYEYMMMYLCALEEEGLKLFPIHRAVYGLEGFNQKNCLRKLAECFDITATADAKEFFEQLEESKHGIPVFGCKLFGDLNFHIATLKNLQILEEFCSGHALCYKRSSVVALHQLVFERTLGISEEMARKEEGVEYIKGLTRDVKAAMLRLSKGDLQALFFLPKPEVSDIVDFARAGETMPQKSTYFYPKVIGGLVLREHAEE